MKIRVANIHGTDRYIAEIEGKFYIPDYSVKKKLHIWTETVIAPERVRLYREVDIIEVIKGLNK